MSFPAELLAAVKYFDQRQDREHNRQQLQTDEVTERISFLELQAQVKLNISNLNLNLCDNLI